MLGAGALGANCEPTPAACGRTRPNCVQWNQVTACINHCLTPVSDGELCAIDSCDLFVGAGIPGAGVCGVSSSCVAEGGSDPRIGRCVFRDPVHFGCSNPIASGSGSDESSQCPYGSYCTPRGAVPNSCGPTDPLQGGLVGLCMRYARVGEVCDGYESDARRTHVRLGACNLCEPGARCVAVNRLTPDNSYNEAGGAQVTEWRCVRTCQSGSDDECDCAGTTPNGVERASRCYSAWSTATVTAPRTVNEGAVCVRPQWCVVNHGFCGRPQTPYCNSVPPPVPNDIKCLARPCCQRGAACINDICVPCIGDGTTLTTESRCCINTFFIPDGSTPTMGRCVPCKAEGGGATSQAQCCPGLRYASAPGATAGVCIRCRSGGQIANSREECCPGMRFLPSTTAPGEMVCDTCRTRGQPATSTDACCPGLVARVTAESMGAVVCAPPCAPCTPPPDPAHVGRCATGVPLAVCPEDGVTPPEMCTRNTAITETCAVEDSDCDGMAFDVDDPILGRPCTDAVLPGIAACGSPPWVNWTGGPYPGWRPLRGHWVCNPPSNAVQCVAIPGIDFCNAANCQTGPAGCSGASCAGILRRQNEDNVLVTVHNTTTPATWNGAQLYRQTSALEPIHWFTGGENGTCLGRCLGTGCVLDSDCGAGFRCGPANTCVVRNDCLAGSRAVSCWNHASGNNDRTGGCR